MLSSKRRSLYLSFIALSLTLTPVLAEDDIRNYQILETIKIPDQITEPGFKFKASEQKLVESESYKTLGKSVRKKRRRNKVCKKFGPIELDFKVNPFRMNRTGLVLNIDLLESYETFSSKASLSEKFKPSKDHNIISDQVKSNFGKFRNWLSSKEAS